MNWKSAYFSIFLCLGTVSMMAQGGINSPFSRFGIGDLEQEGFMHTRQMGGISTSYFDGMHLNFDNPATLSHLQATGFDIGLTSKYSKLKDAQSSSDQWSGNLSYLGFAFPLRNPLNELFSRDDYKFNLGMGFALLPHSSVSYEISTPDSLSNIGEFNRIFAGKGGFYKAVWGNSVRYKSFSLGANVGYLFGKIDNSRNIDFVDERTAYDNEFTTSYSARGLYWKSGLLFSHTFNREEVEDNLGREEPVSISIGLTARSNTGFSTVADIYNVNIGPLSVLGEEVDTLERSLNKPGKGIMPAELGLGVTYYYKNKFAIGADFKKTYWSNYRNDANPEVLEDTYRISLGGYIRPDYNAIGSFMKRVYYRMGVYYEQDPRSINSENIDNYGVTFGLGLPFITQRKISHMNLGLTYGKRSVSDVLSESFVKLSFGFTFNDNEWFIQRKFN